MKKIGLYKYHIYRKREKVSYTLDGENWEYGYYMDCGRNTTTRKKGIFKKDYSEEIIVVQSKNKKNYYRVKPEYVQPADWSKYY